MRAAEIVQQADIEIAAHVPDRNAAALSLWFYDGVRGLTNVLGVLPNAWRELCGEALYGDRKQTVPHMEPAERRAAAEAAGIPHISDAATKLPGLSEAVSEATARRKAAKPYRQQAALDLADPPHEWTPKQIAEQAGSGVTAGRIRGDLKQLRDRLSQR